MSIFFRVLNKNNWVPDEGKETVYLKANSWNDYSFVTMFHMFLHDKDGVLHDIGNIKIGFKGQDVFTETFQKLSTDFTEVGKDFFSLGQGVEFYKNMAALPGSFRKKVLLKLNDIVLQPDIIDEIKGEDVFSTSLLRGVSLSVVKGQYGRVLEGKAELTDFNFRFFSPGTKKFGEIDLDFDVDVSSKPSTNIHAIIGRNGVGKTTLLNGMIKAITDRGVSLAKFFDTDVWPESEISNDYFSSLVSVSFSAFDPFTPPKEQPDPAKGTCYFYIGLKDPVDGELHRAISDLRDDCVDALINCFLDPKKSMRWLNAIEKLGSDENFSSMNLKRLNDLFADVRDKVGSDEQSDSRLFEKKYRRVVFPFLERMSSGHAIVLLTVTRLVATVEEKTIVLLDEPESHLHPPLLSAFVRALSDLLHDRNGLAIIATHSPVVLQEIPSSCVWKIYRRGRSISTSRPGTETFAENVGVLTSEVFSLEVERSGFHDMLKKSVQTGKDYEEVIAEYNGQLGFEGKAILKVLIANRDRSSDDDAS